MKAKKPGASARPRKSELRTVRRVHVTVADKIIAKLVRDYSCGLGECVGHIVSRCVARGSLMRELEDRSAEAPRAGGLMSAVTLTLDRAEAEAFARLARRELGFTLGQGIAFALAWDAAHDGIEPEDEDDFRAPNADSWKGGAL